MNLSQKHKILKQYLIDQHYREQQISFRIFKFKAKFFFGFCFISYLCGQFYRFYQYIDYDLDIMQPKLTQYHTKRLGQLIIMINQFSTQAYKNSTYPSQKLNSFQIFDSKTDEDFSNKKSQQPINKEQHMKKKYSLPQININHSKNNYKNYYQTQSNSQRNYDCLQKSIQNKNLVDNIKKLELQNKQLKSFLENLHKQNSLQNSNPLHQQLNQQCQDHADYMQNKAYEQNLLQQLNNQQQNLFHKQLQNLKQQQKYFDKQYEKIIKNQDYEDLYNIKYKIAIIKNKLSKFIN